MENFMEDAILSAKDALSNNEVPVGCIFVYKNEIISRGGNYVNATKNATRHAEFVCIDKTLEFCKEHNLNYKDVFKEITVVVTVEPCIMCAAALNNLNVKKIIYGCANDRFGGTTVLNVEEILNNKIPIQRNVRADEAMDLLKQFYKGENPSAPISKVRKK